MSKKIEIEVFHVSEKTPDTNDFVLAWLPDFGEWSLASYNRHTKTWNDDGAKALAYVSYWFEQPKI